MFQRLIKRNEDYIIGWPVALPSERVAAEMMLNQQHEKPINFQQHNNDQNSYTWGEIAGHNIIIASPAPNRYGLVTAASTRMAMKHSFPTISFVLAVGIASGIPHADDKPDIRLGDVVVGQAVHQLGLGKNQTSGRLNNPPEVLLRALANLDAKLRLGRSRVPEIMKQAVAKVSGRAQKDFQYPGADLDRLYKSGGIFHKSQQVQRIPRKASAPKIHLASIAIGDTLIRDASLRDSIPSRVGSDCLCIDMMAGGVINVLPCLNVKGISDYADKYASNEWQQYAALAAAAVAKDLLFYVAPQEV